MNQCQEGHEVDPTTGACPAGHPPAQPPPAQGSQAQGGQAAQAQPVSLQCVWAQCVFSTPAVVPTEGNLTAMMRYLEGHVEAEHRQVVQQASNWLMEKLPRPEATLDMSDTQWREFMREWSRYKRSTGISGQLTSCMGAVLPLSG